MVKVETKSSHSLEDLKVFLQRIYDKGITPTLIEWRVVVIDNNPFHYLIVAYEIAKDHESGST